MTTYNFNIESLTPLQVNPGDEVECKAALFKLEKGDRTLTLNQGKLVGATGSATISVGHFLSTEEGTFSLSIPETALDGTYTVTAFFGCPDSSNYYEFRSEANALRVAGRDKPMSITGLTPKTLSISNAKRQISVMGQNLTDARDFLFRKVKGEGPPTLMVREIETGERFAHISISSPSSLLKAGTYRLEAHDPKTGSTVRCPSFFYLKD